MIMTDGRDAKWNPLLFDVRFMTTVQSNLVWRKPTLRFIVKIQGFDPRIFDVKQKKRLTSSSESSLLLLYLPVIITIFAVE
jgi:hypothetical protein